MTALAPQKRRQLLPGGAIAGLFLEPRAQGFFQPRLIGGRERGGGRFGRARLLPHAADQFPERRDAWRFFLSPIPRFGQTIGARLDSRVVSRRAPRYLRRESGNKI
jgi:hypothetical protein